MPSRTARKPSNSAGRKKISKPGRKKANKSGQKRTSKPVRKKANKSGQKRTNKPVQKKANKSSKQKVSYETRYVQGPIRYVQGQTRYVQGPIRYVQGPIRYVQGPTRYVQGPTIQGPKAYVNGGREKTAFLPIGSDGTLSCGERCLPEECVDGVCLSDIGTTRSEAEAAQSNHDSVPVGHVLDDGVMMGLPV